MVSPAKIVVYVLLAYIRYIHASLLSDLFLVPIFGSWSIFEVSLIYVCRVPFHTRLLLLFLPLDFSFSLDHVS